MLPSHSSPLSKRIPDMMKLHSPIRHLHDFDDVETDAPAFYMAAAHESFRCIADVLLLEGRHRFLWFSIAAVCAALDLDEDQRLSIFHDEVDLPMGTLEIAREKVVTLPFQIFFCRRFSVAAKAGRLHSISPWLYGAFRLPSLGERDHSLFYSLSSPPFRQ